MDIGSVPANSGTQSYEFTNLASDVFQPEEIFQLDQPIKPDLVHMDHNQMAGSPPTLLDLGSGTIHRELKSEDYWNQSISSLINDDSNNSSNSRFQINQSPDNTQIPLNNNNLLQQQNGLPSYADDVYNSLQNSLPNQFYPQNTQENGYKSQSSFVDLVGDTKMYFSEENLSNTFDSSFHNVRQCYRTSSCDERYIDIPQYVDYTNILGNSADRIVSELDFKTANCLTNNLHYNMENFDMLHQ